jgi:formamidopyrimidine-DNA glycosylase
MPELPEVEIVARELRATVAGKIIGGIETPWVKSFVNQSREKLLQQAITAVGRKGKYLAVNLNRSSLIIHFRMTGQLIFRNTAEDDPGPYVRVNFKFTDGSSLQFKDTRKFGRIYHIDDPQHILKNVGMDALDEALTPEYFTKILSQRRMGIKAFLLAQRDIAGLGNIYSDESLFRAKIHPQTSTQALCPAQILLLYESIRAILNHAIANMGSTISDYRDVYGNSGFNQNYLKVYQRAGQPCLICGATIERIRSGNRGTHFCPKCQALPKKRGK